MRLDLPCATVRHPKSDLLELDDVPSFVAARLSSIQACETVPLLRARTRVLAVDVHAPMALPPFDHAAVDGYALAAEQLSAMNVPLPVTGRTRAGDPLASARPEAGAVRILTGAPVDQAIAAMVMQENVTRDGDAIRLDQPVRAGSNIRRQGEDVAVGETVMSAGRVLHAGHLGLLAALGIDRVSVQSRIRVAIVAIGNELAAPGRERAPQQIYDANSSMAAAFFERHGCDVISLDRVSDNRAIMRAALSEAIASADIVVTSGGMAVGDEDHTRTLVAEAGGIWHSVGIKMRPGKPASFARVGQAAVLGLPGNPFAALVALVVLGLPMLSALDGRSLPSHQLSASAAFQLDRSPGRAELFPALISRTSKELTIDRLGKGGSARLRPLSTADGLGIISSAAERVLPGDRVGFVSFDAIV